VEAAAAGGDRERDDAAVHEEQVCSSASTSVVVNVFPDICNEVVISDLLVLISNPFALCGFFNGLWVLCP
jgi:hypothetical protein